MILKSLRLKNFRKFNFQGASVTIPYKVEIIKYLNNIDNIANKIGAINTIVNMQKNLKK